MNFAVEGGWREVKLVRDQRVDVGPTASLWRVSFNLTGTTLAVSPENGAVPSRSMKLIDPSNAVSNGRLAASRA